MSIHRLSMWQNDRKVLLSQIIQSLQVSRQPAWVLLEFSGVGRAPGGVSMSVFEKTVSESPSGYRFAPTEFREFVESLQDVSDVKLVGVLDDHREIIEIEGHDSSLWVIWVDDESAIFDGWSTGAN